MYRFQEYVHAAKDLKAMHCYNESIACYYFALLHRMMLGLVSDEPNPMTYDELNPPDEDTHNKVRQSFIIRKLQGTSLSKIREKENFKDDFNDLYELRKLADYGNVNLTLDDELKCEGLYERLYSKVRNYLPISLPTTN